MPEQERYTRGVDAMRADLEANLRELVPRHMSHVEFTVVQNCGRVLSIISRYLITTDAGVPIFLRVQQRIQINWGLVGDSLKVRSLYISRPHGEPAVAGARRSRTPSAAWPSTSSTSGHRRCLASPVPARILGRNA